METEIFVSYFHSYFPTSHTRSIFLQSTLLVWISMLSGSLVTTAGRVLRLRIEEMEGSCEYSE
jgi:hypothetical protein